MNAPLTPDDQLAMAAAKLQRTSPNGWKEFMDALAVLEAARVGDVVRAPADKIFVAQGKAQQCGEFLKIFEGALKKAEQLATVKPK